MLKGNEILGMPIVAYDTGEKIQTVRDLIFDQQGNLLGVLVGEKLWLMDAQVLPLHGIKTIGTDVVVALSQSAIVKANQVPEIREVLARNLVMAGTKVVTEDGRNLGTITDLYFDKKTSVVKGYEVMGGMFADHAFGYSFVPAPESFKMGDDVAFVPVETINLMQEVGDGRKRAVSLLPAHQQSMHLGTAADNDAGTGTNALTAKGTLVMVRGQQIAPPKVQEPSEHSEHHLEIAAVTTASQTDNSHLRTFSSLEQALGRRVRRSVKTEENLYVAALGQIVTPEVIDRARIYGQEQDLLEAIGLELEEAALYYYTNRESRQSRRSRSISKDRTRRFWQALPDVQEIQERFAHRREEQRISKVIGRPLNRIVLDRQDNVILNVGDIITYNSIKIARQAGVLDVLLSSASHLETKQFLSKTQITP